MVSRFVDACSADDRIVAACLCGSHARGEADEYSDLDVCVITRDEAFENVMAETGSVHRSTRRAGIHRGLRARPDRVFILAEGAECELVFGREGALEEFDVGPFRTLIDKRGILNGAEFPWAQPAPDERREQSRQVLNWFWHDLSHFMAALGRGELWWHTASSRRCAGTA